MKTASLLLFIALTGVVAAAPGILNHQGRIAVGGVNFDGTGHFKFALVVDATASETVWTNDGSNTGNPGGEPTRAVPVSVAKGHYAMPLGDSAFHANMNNAIGADLFATFDDLRLRVWFSQTGTAGSFELLSPDRRMTSAGYALGAAQASTVADGAITTAKLADAAVSGNKIAADAVGSAQLVDGAVSSIDLADRAVTLNKLATTPTVATFAGTINNPAPGEDDYFGSAVAAVGVDKLLIGAPEDDTGASDAGSAYLYDTNGALLLTINNPTPEVDDQFGFSVACVGADKLIIGARLDNTGATSAGSAYLYDTDGTLLATFNNPTPDTSDNFGYSVAALGTDKLLIGAPFDGSGLGVGAAYLYKTDGTLLATFNNPTPAAGDQFGSAVVAVGADKLLLGAPEDDTSASGAGSAYLFDTGGTLLTTINNPTPEANDAFGFSVATVGADKLLIGAPFNGASSAGAAYLYDTAGTLLATIDNPTPQADGQFGISVATLGADTLLVGARGGRDGAAYLFDTGGTLRATINQPTPEASAQFGRSVAAVGTGKLLIGAPRNDTGARDAGSAYLFDLSGHIVPGLLSEGVTDAAITIHKLATTAAVATFAGTINNPAPPSDRQSFGSAVAAVGTDKLLIGAREDDTGADDAGAAFLFDTEGFLLATFNNPTPELDDEFGFSVAAVGTDKLLVGAYHDNTGASDAGSAYLFGTSGTLLATINNPSPDGADRFGYSVAAVGGDTLLIGAPFDNTGASRAGSAYLFDADGMLLATINNPTPVADDFFGLSVAAVGTDKLLIGAPEDDTGASDAGSVYLFDTDGTLLATITNPNPAAGDQFGRSVAAVGTDRLLIGAPFDNTGANSAGAAYLFDTGGTLLATFNNPTPATDFFGYSVAAIGTDTLLIGAPLDNTGASSAGSGYLFHTGGTLLATINNPTPEFGDNFGHSVAAVGAGKLLIGAPSDGASDAGSAYLFDLSGFFLPGLLSGGVTDGAITAAALDTTSVGLWSVNGGDVYRDSGKVGIGTASPSSTLHVDGDAFVTGSLRDAAGVSGTAGQLLSSSGSGIAWTDLSLSLGGDTLSLSGGNSVDLGQYFRGDGSEPFAGNLDLGGNDLINAGGLKVSDSSYPVATIERTASSTTGIRGGLQLLGSTTANMTSGFGVLMEFAIEDNASGPVGIAQIAAERQGADDISHLIFRTANGGAPANQMRLDQNGNLTTNGTVNGVSDRDKKENFQPVDPAEVLEKIAAMPIARWNYKHDAEDTPHLGPVAQDFHKAFGLGADDKHIATVDADGVALAAIQALKAENDAKAREIADLKRQNAAILKRLAALEGACQTNWGFGRVKP